MELQLVRLKLKEGSISWFPLREALPAAACCAPRSLFPPPVPVDLNRCWVVLQITVLTAAHSHTFIELNIVMF